MAKERVRDMTAPEIIQLWRSNPAVYKKDESRFIKHLRRIDPTHPIVSQWDAAHPAEAKEQRIQLSGFKARGRPPKLVNPRVMNLVLESRTCDGLRAVAQDLGTSLSDLSRQVLDSFLAQHDAQRATKEQPPSDPPPAPASVSSRSRKS